MNKKTLFFIGIIVTLLFLFIFAIKFISYTGRAVDDSCVADYNCGEWSACEGGIQKRSCNDLKCGQDSIVERKVCDEVFCERTDYQCGIWSSCTYTEKVEDVFNSQISFKGFQERICRDITGCGGDRREERKCQDTNKIEFVVKEFCGEKFLTAVDLKTGKPVSKISLSSWESRKLDITFIQDERLYCGSCYNGIKDEKESGIDCGGDCKECLEEEEDRSENYEKLSFGASLIFLAILFGLVVFEYREMLKKKGYFYHFKMLSEGFNSQNL